MASLKEIKGRIKSVKSTQKITSAMKMISSAKLHKAQNMVENFLPYERQLTRILGNYLAAEETYTTPLAERREEIRRVTLVAVTSNSSLCGAFNSNIIGMFAKMYKEYLSQNVEGSLEPDHIQDGLFVAQGKIDMPGRRRGQVGYLPAHPHERKFSFKNILDGLGQGTDGENVHNGELSG